ncbi:hypothetical protein GCM10009738_68270 [Kitasatospora viridis]
MAVGMSAWAGAVPARVARVSAAAAVAISRTGFKGLAPRVGWTAPSLGYRPAGAQATAAAICDRSADGAADLPSCTCRLANGC